MHNTTGHWTSRGNKQHWWGLVCTACLVITQLPCRPLQKSVSILYMHDAWKAYTHVLGSNIHICMLILNSHPGVHLMFIFYLGHNKRDEQPSVTPCLYDELPSNEHLAPLGTPICYILAPAPRHTEQSNSPLPLSVLQNSKLTMPV